RSAGGVAARSIAAGGIVAGLMAATDGMLNCAADGGAADAAAWAASAGDGPMVASSIFGMAGGAGAVRCGGDGWCEAAAAPGGHVNDGTPASSIAGGCRPSAGPAPLPLGGDAGAWADAAAVVRPG